MITPDNLRECIEVKGMTITKYADKESVSISYISQLCTKFGIKTRGPGRPPGTKQTEETKLKISESVRAKQGGINNEGNAKSQNSK